MTEASVYAKNLKRLMRKRSMSNERLHDMTGISRNSICCYKSGKVEPTVSKILLIAKALRFDVGEFFKE